MIAKLEDITKNYTPVHTSMEGLRTFVLALNRAMPPTEVANQETLSRLAGIKRSTFASLLDSDRITQTGSIPLEKYENMRRLLRPRWPGMEEEITFEDMLSLFLKEDDAIESVRYSRLANEIEKQLRRNMKREGNRSYSECWKEMADNWIDMPIDGRSFKSGKLSKEKAYERFQLMLDGRYTPNSDLETGLLAALIEKDEYGNTDQNWIKWICGLIPDALYQP